MVDVRRAGEHALIPAVAFCGVTMRHSIPSAAKRRAGVWRATAVCVAVVLAIGVYLGFALLRPSPSALTAWLGMQHKVPEATSQQVHEFCGACHAYPPADSFPKSAWKKEVEQGYVFFRASRLHLLAPPLANVVEYYERRAPESLPLHEPQPGHLEPPAIRFQRIGFEFPELPPT